MILNNILFLNVLSPTGCPKENTPVAGAIVSYYGIFIGTPCTLYIYCRNNPQEIKMCYRQNQSCPRRTYRYEINKSGIQAAESGTSLPIFIKQASNA